MTGVLTDLDRAVIEALGAHYARGGEAAFDEAASRLVVAICALLARTRGTARLLDLIKLVEAVNAMGGERRGKLHYPRRTSPGSLAIFPRPAAPRREIAIFRSSICNRPKQSQSPPTCCLDFHGVDM